MNNNYTALFRLVQAAIGNSYNSLPDNVDWGAVVDLAAKHGVGALTMDGLNALFQTGYIAKEQIPNRVSALLYLGAYFDRIPGHGVHLYFMQTEANTDGHH